MSFQIYRKGRTLETGKERIQQGDFTDVLVKMEKTFAGTARYFKREHPNLRGFSARTLKTKMPNAGSQYIKGKFRIDRTDPTDTKRKIFLKLRNGQTNVSLFSRTYTARGRAILLNDQTKQDIMNKIVSMLNDFPRRDSRRRKFQISFWDGVRSAQNFFNSTYEDLNEMRRKIPEIIEDILSRYRDYKIKRITVNMTSPDFNFGRQIVYGSLTKNQKFLKSYLSNLFKNNNNLTRATMIRKTKELTNKYSIISPITKKNCFIIACYIAKNKKRPNKSLINTVNKFIKDNKLSKEIRSIENLSKYMSLKMKVNIIVTDNNFRIYKSISDHDQTINLFVFGSHIYALIDKKEGLKCDFFNDKGDLPTEYSKKIENKIIEKKDDFKICTYDLETCDEIDEKKFKNKAVTYAVGFYDGNIYKDFYKCDYEDPIKEFIKYLINGKLEKIIIYAHNGGKFDLWLILRHLLNNCYGIITNIIVKNGRIINLLFRSKGKEIYFRDSICFLLCSLDELCNSFKTKTKKLIDDVDHDKININNCGTKEIKEYTQQYLKNDNLCLYELLINFDKIIKEKLTNNKFGIKEVLTNASIARNIFLSEYYKKDKTPIYNITDERDEYLREFYYGGRNECFEHLGLIEGKLYYYDFCSLYPYCLLKNMPYGTPKIQNFDDLIIDKNTDENIYKDWFGFVEVELKHIHKRNKPFHAIKKNHKLLFPYFKNYHRLIITSEELKYSLQKDLGYRYKIKKVLNYKYSKYYAEMIKHLYKLKIDAQIENNTSLRLIAKIIINASYGFWGIKRKIENIEIFRPKNGDIENKKMRIINKFNDYFESNKLIDYELDHNGYSFFKFEDKLKVSCSNVGIAFFTCAYARTKLYDLFHDIKRKKGLIYYCDTDSVITNFNIEKNPELRKKYITPINQKVRLGDLTNESDQKQGYYKKLITLGNKIYYLKNLDLEKKKELLKFKGLNIKKYYEKRIIDYENKIIEFRNLKKKCKNECDCCVKFSEKDFDLLNNGYYLSCECMTFESGSNIIYKDKNVNKVINNISFKKMYLKGNVDKNNKIIPFNI